MFKRVITFTLVLAMIAGLALTLGACTNAEKPQETEASEAPQESRYAIPRINIIGRVSGMEKKTDVRKVRLEYDDGVTKFTSYATLKVQGAHSLSYDKKNYTLHFYEDETYTNKRKIDMGWGAENQYVLKANWVDKTKSRNVVTARIASKIYQKYGILENTPNYGTIDGYPVEVYQSGRFLGLYTLNIPKDAWMFNMNKKNPNHLAFCGYAWKPSARFLELPSYDAWELEVGEENQANLDKLTRLFRFVLESSDAEFVRDFEEYMCKDAILNYVILVETALLWDNNGKNMFLITYDGEYWYPCFYDMDESWGSRYNGKVTMDYTPIPMTDENLLFRRVRTLFSKELAERYFELREDILTKESIMQEFYDFGAMIPEESFEKETQRWGEDIPGFEYSQIEEYLDVRLPLLDAYMEDLLKGGKN